MLKRTLCALLAALMLTAIFCASQAEQADLASAMMAYLDCPSTYFPPAEDDAAILRAWEDACIRGEEEGFVPVLVAVDDVLWQMLQMNSDESPVYGSYEFNAGNAAQYRAEMLAQPLRDGKEVLDELTDLLRDELESYGFDWEADVVGEMGGGEASDQLMGHRDLLSGKTMPLILAEIPVDNPWEVFAYLPFGGWNYCPDTPELMAAAKHWYEQYGAVPAVVTGSTLEFVLPAPASDEQAMDLALEQSGFCPDLLLMGEMTAGMLADSLRQSTVWFFWWD